MLENFRPGVMARLGLDERRCGPSNPGLIYASLSGYGQDGPWAGRRAYAVITQAEMGMTAGSIAHRGGEPANEPYSHADVYAGLHTLSAILAALHQRDRTGGGQRVEVSMAESLLFVNEHVQSELADVDGPGRGLSHWRAGESPVCETGEGHLVTIAGHPCASPARSRCICAAMGRDDLATTRASPRRPARLAHREELVRRRPGLGAYATPTSRRSSRRWPTRGSPWAWSARCARWPRATGPPTVARSPRVSDRRGGTVRIPNSPWRFSAASARARGAPAYRGEHNREVLAELLGLDDAELDRLRRPASSRAGSPADLRRPSREGDSEPSPPTPDAARMSVPLPYDIEPMKAVLGDLPTDRPGWAYEIKWDGMRALTFIDDGLSMRSTRRLELADRFPELAGLRDQPRRPPGRARWRGCGVR